MKNAKRLLTLVLALAMVVGYNTNFSTYRFHAADEEVSSESNTNESTTDIEVNEQQPEPTPTTEPVVEEKIEDTKTDTVVEGEKDTPEVPTTVHVAFDLTGAKATVTYVDGTPVNGFDITEGTADFKIVPVEGYEVDVQSMNSTNTYKVTEIAKNTYRISNVTSNTTIRVITKAQSSSNDGKDDNSSNSSKSDSSKDDSDDADIVTSKPEKEEEPKDEEDIKAEEELTTWQKIKAFFGISPLSDDEEETEDPNPESYTGEYTHQDATEVDQISVTINYSVDGNVINTEKKNVKAVEGEYPFSYTANYDKDVYEIESLSDDTFTLDGDVISKTITEKEDATVTVILTGKPATYTVVERIPTKGNKTVNPDDSSTYTENSLGTQDGYVNAMTEVTAATKEGFEAEEVNQQQINADGSTVVYVDYTRETYKLNYNTNGGSYIKSQTGLYEESVEVFSSEEVTCPLEEHTHTTKPSTPNNNQANNGTVNGCWKAGWSWGSRVWNLNCGKEEHTHSSKCQYTNVTNAPTKNGYTFDGWYADEACTVKADEKVTLDKDVTVYAKWTPKTATYTIVYMSEKIINDNNDTDYVYAGSKEATGTVGQSVTASNGTSIAYHTYNGSKSTTATINPDGSTVVYAYYDLTEYELTFKVTSSAGTKGKINIGGKEYTGSNYKIKVKLGQNVVGVWPGSDYVTCTDNTNNKFAGWSYTASGSGTQLSNILYISSNFLPNNGTSTTLTVTWSTDGFKYAIYYLEDENGDYIPSPQYSQGIYVSSLSAKTIYGYTNISKPSGKTGSGNNSGNTKLTDAEKTALTAAGCNNLKDGTYVYRFYYSINKYKIDYYYGSTKLNTKSDIRFGANINTDTYKSAPTKPSDVDSEATFGGWYDNAALQGNSYSFTTMPSNDVALYAKWVLPEKTVTMDPTGGSLDNTTVTVTKGDVGTFSVPTKSGYDFVGWYTDEACTEEFDVNAPITKNATIYAKWVKSEKTSYTVKYVDKDGKDIAESKKVENKKPGSTVQESAKSIDGYVLTSPYKQSITLKQAGDDNVITFTYSKLADMRYVIEYRYGDTVVYSNDNNGEKFNPNGKAEFALAAPQADIDAINAKGYQLKETSVDVNLNVTGETVVFEVEPEDFTITYVLNGGTVSGNPTSYTVLDKAFTLKNPTKEGYDFVGWKEATKSDYKASTSVKVDPSKSIGNLTFTANWKAQPRTVTVKYVDDKGNTLKDNYVINGKYDDDYDVSNQIPSTIQKDNNNYVKVSQSTNTVSGKLTKNVEITVTYKLDNNGPNGEPDDIPDDIEYSLTYNANGGSGSMVDINIYPVDYVITLKENAFTRTGYSFTNWSESANGGEAVTTVKMVEGGKTVYAQWNINKYNYTVNYVWGDTVVATSRNEKNFGEEVTVNPTAPSGYTLKDNSSKSITISENEANNVITFNLRKNVTLTSNSSTKKYDGNKKTVEGYTSSESAATFGHISAKAEGTDAGNYTNVFKRSESFGLVTTTDKEEIKGTVSDDDLYIVTNLVEGELVINPRTITLTSGSAEREYNGKPLTNRSVEVGGDGFVENEGATYDVTGSQTKVGSSENTFTYTLNENTKATNYSITTVNGTLTVTTRNAKYEASVTAKSGSKTYNGSKLTVSGLVGEQTGDNGTNVEVTIDEVTYKIYGYTATAEATHVSESGNVNVVGTPRVYDEAGNDVTDEFAVTTNPGTITITPAPVTITTGSAEKVYDGSALTAGGSITGIVETDYVFTVTGTQTAVGSSTNEYTLDWGSAVEGDYTVSETKGTLKVTKQSIEDEPDPSDPEDPDKVTSKVSYPEDSVYDGKDHMFVPVVTNSQGATVPTSEYDVTYSTQNFKDVQTIEVTITAKESGNYSGTVTRTYQITKAPLTVVTESASKAYDGQYLTAGGTITGFVEGETYEFETTGKQKSVGTSDNTYELTYGTAKENNYEITSVSIGTLTVTKTEAEIVVTTTGGTHVYDGNEYGATVQVTGLPDGYTAQTATSSAKATHVSESKTATCDTLVILDDNGKDVTQTLSENIQYVDGTITITPAPVTITTGSAEKVYDGSALTAGGSITGIVETDYVFTVTGTQTAVGSSTNEYTLDWGSAVEGDYTVSETKGTLKVTEYAGEITVTTTGGTFTYDGTSHAANVSVSTLPTGYTVETATSDDTVTHVADGEVAANCDKLVIKNAQNVDVTNELNIKYVNGTLKVNPTQLTVTTGSASKVYDGTELTCSTIDVAGWIGDEIAPYEATGGITNVGTNGNSYVIKWTDASATAAQTDYTVSSDLGTLTVVKQSINPDDPTDPQPDPDDPDGPVDPDQPVYNGATVNSPQSVPYDGQAHKWSPTVKDGETTLVEGTDYTVAYSTTDFTNVTGTITVTITGAGNYGGTVTRTYEITPLNVTLTSATASKVYDGTPLTNSTVTPVGFISGEGATYDVTGSQTTVGSSANAFTYTLNENTKASNYTITKVEGTLTVVKQSINPGDPTDPQPDPDDPDGPVDPDQPVYNGATVDSPENVVYNGKDQKWVPTVKDANGKDIEVNVEYTGDVKNVTEAGITVTITPKDTENYGGSVTRTYKITPAPITIETASASKVYDGDALTKTDGYTFSGLVNNETATFTVTGSITDVGSDDNTYDLAWDGTAAKTNYEIVSETIGKLTVTESEDEIVITTTGGTFTYDGNEHKATTTAGTLPKGYTVKDIGSNDSATHVADGKVTANCDTLVIVNKAGKDVTDKLKITYVNDTIEITPATLTVTTESANKVYDGDALEADGSITGFVKEETATFTVTGSQTNVGTSENTYTVVFDKTAAETDYTVSATTGTLTVVKQSINPGDPTDPQPDPDDPDGPVDPDQPVYNGSTVNNPKDVPYNGSEQKWEPTVKDGKGNTLTAGTDYEVTYSTEDFTNVTGKITVTITGKGNFGGSVTRTYEITPLKVTLTSATDTKVYDGTPLTNPEVKAEGFITGEGATYDVTGSQTEAGTSDNTFTYTLDRNTKATNYTITKVEGTLTVTEQSIVPGDDPENPDPSYKGIEIDSPTNHVYDGQEHVWSPTVKDADGNVLVEGTDYEVSYDTEDFTNVTGYITVTINGIGNYKGSTTRQYQITPARLVITTNSANKVFDGDALTAEGKVTGLVNGETVTFKVTGSQTDVGSSRNTYSIEWNKTAVKSNYTITEKIGTLTVTPVPVNPPVNPPVEPQPQPPVENNPDRPTQIENGEQVVIEPEEEPLAPLADAYWALVNLICVIITGLLGIIILLGKHKKSEEKDEEEDETANGATVAAATAEGEASEEEEEDEDEFKRRRWTKVFAIIVFICSVIAFILTEDMTLPWIWVDKWTLLMVIIAIIQLVDLVIARKWKDANEDEEEEEQPQQA